jgi:hypothetical protein
MDKHIIILENMWERKKETTANFTAHILITTLILSFQLCVSIINMLLSLRYSDQNIEFISSPPFRLDVPN